MNVVSAKFQSQYRVGLDAHLLSLTQTYRGAGINGYIYQLLRHLPGQGAGPLPMRYVAFMYAAAFESVPGLAVRRSRWDTRSPWRRILWEQTRLALLSRDCDLLHGMAYAAPLAAACPTVITVHDLSFLRFPEAFRRFNRVYLSTITRLSARRAARVIAVSESTRQDVIALCGVPPHKVVTIPNGVDEVFSPADDSAVAEFRRRRGLPQRFILFLGTLEPRKNLVRLLDAYARVRSAIGARAAYRGDLPKLVIAGGKGWFFEKVYARVSELGLQDDVIFPGFVPGTELPWWYRAAEVFAYPSRFEGFGLPVLEALASGTPVVTSNVSSLPEVAGDAALLVDPDDTVALAEALERVLVEPDLRARLREAGPGQAARFSWARTAAATASLYGELLGASVPGGAG